MTEAPERRRNPRGQGARLRADLLRAATDLIAESRGQSELTLRRIARQVGITPTSVYLHFPDIDHLKVAVVEEGYALLDEAREAAGAGLDDPAERLLVRCRAYCRFAIDHPGHYRLMYGPELPPTMAIDADRSPGRRALQQLADGIERCRAAGLIGPDLDPHRRAISVWAGMHGLVTLRIDRPHFPWPPLEEMADEMVTRLLGLHHRPDQPVESAGGTGSP